MFPHMLPLIYVRAVLRTYPITLPLNSHSAHDTFRW